MAYKVSNEARNDIFEIGRYTQEKWSKKQRQTYLSGLEEKFQFLAENPLSNRERTEFSPSVRIHSHEKHLVVYLSGSAHILIVRVLHESMDVKRQLNEDGRA